MSLFRSIPRLHVCSDAQCGSCLLQRYIVVFCVLRLCRHACACFASGELRRKALGALGMIFGWFCPQVERSLRDGFEDG